MRIFIITACALVAGCAAPPQQTLMDLSPSDPKFNSPACVDMRNRALGYDDKTGTRIGVGLASGLLLGPLGIPIAAMADASQNKEREAYNYELQLRCSSKPPPPKPT